LLLNNDLRHYIVRKFSRKKQRLFSIYIYYVQPETVFAILHAWSYFCVQVVLVTILLLIYII